MCVLCAVYNIIYINPSFVSNQHYPSMRVAAPLESKAWIFLLEICFQWQLQNFGLEELREYSFVGQRGAKELIALYLPNKQGFPKILYLFLGGELLEFSPSCLATCVVSSLPIKWNRNVERFLFNFFLCGILKASRQSLVSLSYIIGGVR